MDLSRDDDGGATQDRSNAPITTTNDPEQVGMGILGNVFFCQQAVTSCCGLRSVVVIIVLLMMCSALKQDFFQVSETKCCCFFKRKMRKKKTGRSKWPPGFGKIQKFLSRGGGGGGDAEEEMGGAVSHAHSRGCEELKLLKSDKSENVSGGESKV